MLPTGSDDNMKILSVCASLKIINISAHSKYPPIQFGIGGSVRVLLEGCVTVEDKNIYWEDMPIFKCHTLSSEENAFITRQITPYLLRAADNLRKQIQKIHCDVKETFK